MRGDVLVRCGGRAGETDRQRCRHRAPVRPTTKLQGPGRGEYFHLYVMLDIFSRYAVGWTVAAAESAELAKAFITDITATHGAPQAIHADRGTSMTSKPVAQLLVDLGVARSHSRPRVSNDNPYSELAFRTSRA